MACGSAFFFVRVSRARVCFARTCWKHVRVRSCGARLLLHKYRLLLERAHRHAAQRHRLRRDAKRGKELRPAQRPHPQRARLAMLPQPEAQLELDKPLVERGELRLGRLTLGGEAMELRASNREIRDDADKYVMGLRKVEWSW